MALSDTKVRTAKVSAGKKQEKLSDGGGLYLLVNASGKYWKLAYRFAGKQKTLSIGIYGGQPHISLKKAREARDVAKGLMANGIDPSQSKQAEKRRQAVQQQDGTFKGVASEWMKQNTKKWAATTLANTQARLDKHILPWLGTLPVASITALDVLSVVRRAEQRGTIETAHRLKMVCSQVMRYAVATGRTNSDPTRDLLGAITPVVNKHRATIQAGNGHP